MGKEFTLFSTAPADQYTTVRGIRTRYWTSGQGGTPILLIHGLGGSVESWIRNVQALGEHHLVYAPDLPGFGRAEKVISAPRTFATFAEFIRAFMDQEGIDKAHLVGSSMGGGVSLQFAIDFPERLDKLVLVASAGMGESKPHRFYRLAALPLIGEWLTRPSREGAAESWRVCLYNPELLTDELVDRAYELYSLPGASRAFLATTRALLGPLGPRDAVLRPIREGLATITAPTLIVWGREDEVLPVSGAYAGAECIANARLHIFERCGHLPHFEFAEEFNALLSDFLQH